MICNYRSPNVITINIMIVIKLNEVQPGKHGYNIYVKVLESREHEVKRMDNTTLKINEGEVGDDTARINYRIVGKYA